MLRLILFSSILYCFACTNSVKGTYSIEPENLTSIDSFEVSLPKYSFTNRLLTNELDSLIFLTKKKRTKSNLPLFLGVRSQRVNSNIIRFQIYSSKAYNIAFCPRDSICPQVFDKGFGIAHYKNHLIKLSGKLSHYDLAEQNSIQYSLIESDDANMIFSSYKIQGTNDKEFIDFSADYSLIFDFDGVSLKFVDSL
ncbi:MAG: hypothetical protein MK226_07170 [Saprospiraceae bacterium]|nr:hypothetical protein [Saprospiraceae bacterium]